jgi:hypothetical protein
VPLIHPKDLPECDVMEFDCNSAELTIIRDMKIRPRALIIELEAPFYKELFEGKEHPRNLLKELDKKGYVVVKQMGHEGQPISHEELLWLIDKEFETGKKQKLKNGAKDSPVILAVREDYCKLLKKQK